MSAISGEVDRDRDREASEVLMATTDLHELYGGDDVGLSELV